MKIVYIYITSWIVSTTGKVCNIYIYTNFPYFSPDKSLSSHGFVVTAPGHFTGCSVHYRSIPLQFTEQYAWHLLEGNNMDNYSSSFLSSLSTSFSSSSSSSSFSISFYSRCPHRISRPPGPWMLPSFTGFSTVLYRFSSASIAFLVGLTGFFQGFLRFCHWVLLGSARFYWVLPGFYWVLLGFIGFVRFYRVLLGFSSFC